MGNAAIIEVAIGLIFIFSLLSILVTQINTLIINFLNLKAKRLKEQLDMMLTDPVIRAKILTHPLIGMVEAAEGATIVMDPSVTLSAQSAESLTEDKKARVSYINSKEFVDVLVDVLTARTGKKLYEELDKVIGTMPPSINKSKFRELLRQIQLQGTGLPQLRDLIDTLEDAETQKQMLYALNLVDAALDKFQVESSDMIPLVLGIRQIGDKYMQTALEAVITASHSLNDAQEKLGHWFDSGMERASQVYLREMQRFSLVIGFLLALILNVDTLHVSQVLWEDPALRTAIAVTAATNVPQLENEITDSQAAPNGDLEESANEVQDTLRQLLDLRLPIGWRFVPPTDETQGALEASQTDSLNVWAYWPGNNPDWFGTVVRKIIGLLITTIAVAQGAPFWFDLLKRLTRGGGGDSG